MSEDLKQAELESLRDTAKLMGLEFHPNTGASKLSAMIKEAQESKAAPKEAAVKVSPAVSKLAAVRAEALKLVRVLVVPNDPAKKEYNGEYFAVGNSVLGTVRRYVPYNNEAGWHIEQVILNVLRDKKIQQFVSKKTRNGVETSEPRLIPAFTIVEMPALSDVQLKELAASQNARQAV